MANAFIHNSILSDEQARAIMEAYTHFVSPKAAAAQVGVSRQTTHGLFLKFSQRLHAASRWEQAVEDEARRDIFQWLTGVETQAAYGLYRDGPALEDYRIARQGRMLSREHYGPYIVARELKDRWGKISEKAFVFHYALIQRTAECRIDWMRLLGTDDVSDPRVVVMAARQLAGHLEENLRRAPLGRLRREGHGAVDKPG